MEFVIRSVEPEALEGKATRKQVAILFDKNRPDLYIDLLIYLPNDAVKPVPALRGLNFYGNQTIHVDEGIRYPSPVEIIGLIFQKFQAELEKSEQIIHVCICTSYTTGSGK